MSQGDNLPSYERQLDAIFFHEAEKMLTGMLCTMKMMAVIAIMSLQVNYFGADFIHESI